MLRLTWAAVVLVGTGAMAGATDPLVAGHRAGYPLVSPPGWLGPGPAGHTPQPNYNDWQYYGVAGGPTINPGTGYRPLRYAPGYFGFPGAFNGFWTNGLSLYGPPTPTYAPTPGTFGNVDASRRFFDYPVLFPGYGPYRPALGVAGYYSPSPRHLPLSVSVHPPSVNVVPGPPAVGADGAPCIRLTVAVADPAADVWVQKVATTQRGVERTFESPPVEAGRRYEYEIVARWTEGGKDKAETRQVSATPGETVRVDFTRPADGR